MRYPDRDAQEAMLASAEKRFAEAGYAGTSVQDIVAGTGFTRPTLYYHFQSKEGLFRALLDRAYDECYELMQKAVARPGSVRDKLVEILAAHFEFLRDRQDLTRLVFAAAFAAPREVPQSAADERRRRRNFDLAHAVIRQGVRAGEFDRRFGSRELTYGFWGALSFHLMAHVLLPGNRLNRRSARRVVDLFMDGARKP